MYLAKSDPRFKERADYIVRGLKEVQEKNGDGYLCALENGREAFAAVSKGDIRAAYAFNLNGLWSPWCCGRTSKTFAGLQDAYRYTGQSRGTRRLDQVCDLGRRACWRRYPRTQVVKMLGH